MIQVQGECYNFKIEWSQMYNYSRAGKGQLKPEVNDLLKRRSAPGSRCCESPAATYLLPPFNSEHSATDLGSTATDADCPQGS